MVFFLSLKTASLTESQLHILIELIKAVIALTVFIIIFKKRKKRQKKIDSAVDKINKHTHL